jgi:hypothetical protein
VQGRARDKILARAEAADWPELLVDGVGRVAGAVGWTVAVEAATGNDLVLLSRLLLEAAA